MRLNRFTTAAVLAASALALAACDPDGSPVGAAPGTASAAAPTAGGAAAPSPATSKPAGGAESPGKSGAGTAKASPPAADCAAGAAALGTVVVAVDAAESPKTVLKARAAKFVCGPDVPGEGYFEAAGDAKTYEFASGAQAFVLIDLKPKQATPQALAALVKACAKDPNSAPDLQHCYGNQLALKLDAQGRITTATQLYHP
ncbi:hypothetical protein ACI1MP_01130 [Kitasatospora griseola]|uniref:hypothetical protein n=1 Tax=Kitasatospora griseola TaxID=2064 RepID=UPI00385607B9